MFSSLSSSLVFSTIEYFSYLNLWLIILFLFLCLFYLIFSSCQLLISSILCSGAVFEFSLIFLCFLFIVIIISPALIILLDAEIIIIPSFIVYSCGYQWAWTFSFNYLNWISNCDHYLYSSYYLVNQLQYRCIIGFVLFCFIKHYYFCSSIRVPLDYFLCLFSLSSFNVIWSLVTPLKFSVFICFIWFRINSNAAFINNSMHYHWLQYGQKLYAALLYFAIFFAPLQVLGIVISYEISFVLGNTEYLLFLLFNNASNTSIIPKHEPYFSFDLSFFQFFEDYIDDWLSFILEHSLIISYIITGIYKFEVVSLIWEYYYYYSFTLSYYLITMNSRYKRSIFDDNVNSYSIYNNSCSSSLHYIERKSSLYIHNLNLINYLFYFFTTNTTLLIPILSIIRFFVFSYDVIHSLGIYSFGIKIDAIPGRFNFTSTIRTLIKGEHRGSCFELCGHGHSSMLIKGKTY